MEKDTFRFAIAAAALLLVGSSAAQAAVTPLDTFSFDVVGFNLASGMGSFITPDETAAFGATTTFPGVGIDGQDITITSSEAIGPITTTDMFTVSTPSNFITEASLDGMLINGLQFDLGDSNSGGNTVSLLVPITSYTASASVLYGTSLTTAATPNTMLATGGAAYSAAPAVNSGSSTTSINGFTVHGFTYSITYGTVPEPSTWAILGLGAVAGVLAFGRRRLAALR